MARQPDVNMNGQKRKTCPPAHSGFGLYCIVMGMAATALGAAASLLAAGLVARVVVWAVVLIATTVGAAWWWNHDPTTARRWTVGLLVRPAVKTAPHRKSW
ncbi:hypothetical protein TUSST3_82240 [Streptomyces sp. TUS-ST3]|nr:hypothetical protein TUSST3_82240 [Streptomyces sp. TUS-ST3]